MGKFIDLTMRLEEGMPVYPGDPVFRREKKEANRFKRETSYQVFSLGSHHGTHIDFPSHIFEDGATSSDYDNLDDFVMLGTIYDLTGIGKGYARRITSHEVSEIEGVEGTLLLYTGFTEIATPDMANDFPYLTKHAAETILHNNPHIRRLGIDSFSVDMKKHLEAHKVFLVQGIPIIEGLTNLSKVDVMRRKNFTFHCIPLRVGGADAVPVRAYAEF